MSAALQIIRIGTIEVRVMADGFTRIRVLSPREIENRANRCERRWHAGRLGVERKISRRALDLCFYRALQLVEPWAWRAAMFLHQRRQRLAERYDEGSNRGD